MSTPDTPDTVTARESAATSAQDRLSAATALHQEGQLDQAVHAYRDILAHQFGHHAVWLLLGMAELQRSHFEPAAEALERSLQLNPNAPIARVSLGHALQGLGRHALAIGQYDQGLALNPAHPDAWFQRGISLLAERRYEEAIASFSNVLVLVPDHVGAFNNSGEALRYLMRYEEAIVRFDAALVRDPFHRDSLLNRGATLQTLGRTAAALADFDTILARAPHDTIALNNRGNALEALNRHDEALESFDRAIAIAPDQARAWLNRAHTLSVLGREKDARASIERACAIDPTSHEAKWNLGLAQLHEGEFGDGWRNFESRWFVDYGFENPRHEGLPKWLGDADLRGKCILLWAEQGLGDTLQFCRYAPIVAALGAQVVLEVQAELVPLLRANLPGIDVIALDAPFARVDYATPLMSLPFALKTEVHSVPASSSYLQSDAAALAHWREKLDGLVLGNASLAHMASAEGNSAPAARRLRIGVAVSGSPKHTNDRNRSMPAHYLEQLARIADLHIVQKGLRDTDAAFVGAHPAIYDHGAELGDLHDTAALISALDAVVSVDTSIAHLAGALGKVTAIMLPHRAEWRWLRERSDTPWYPRARLIRQPAAGDWTASMSEVCEMIAAIEPPLNL